MSCPMSYTEPSRTDTGRKDIENVGSTQTFENLKFGQTSEVSMQVLFGPLGGHEMYAFGSGSGFRAPSLRRGEPQLGEGA